ncbi:Hemerythrin-like domain-containing protein [Cognatiyoonia koreensis]|uniref:Hemerythrin-like domain-containing protein n=1 Tax=Cognatiyoonia koreensis TaxID=364200 RepID=A0A1I0QUR5_9RHOB|nr:hemerythrin domain-containing protein [Cognatiyoonia koreensis]SEW31174.1 Hemerythrin-like domain-containing protein [Cognatiyoonia koreensis]
MSTDDGRRLVAARGQNARAAIPHNPLDLIAEDHMREREVCTMIDRLVADLPIADEDLKQLNTFLRKQLPQHLADEETDLFPMMLSRCEPEDEIDKVIDRLLSDHSHAIADAPAVAEIIQSRATTVASFSDADKKDMKKFAHHSRRHLILENAVILPIARARLTAGDLKQMMRHMLERRGLKPMPDDA